MPTPSLVDTIAEIFDPAAFGSGDDNPTFRQEQPRLKARAREKAQAALKARAEWFAEHRHIVPPITQP